MLTGAGLKDLGVLEHQPFAVRESSLDALRRDLARWFSDSSGR